REDRADGRWRGALKWAQTSSSGLSSGARSPETTRNAAARVGHELRQRLGQDAVGEDLEPARSRRLERLERRRVAVDDISLTIGRGGTFAIIATAGSRRRSRPSYRMTREGLGS